MGDYPKFLLRSSDNNLEMRVNPRTMRTLLRLGLIVRGSRYYSLTDAARRWLESRK